MSAASAVAVVDYGGGNLGSLVAALGRLGAEYVVTSDPATVRSAAAAILPGDGAFASTLEALRSRGLDGAILDVARDGRPFLGICVGMQLLYENSLEHGEHAGLGILPGTIARFEGAPRVPHMGWNQLTLEREHPFVAGLASGAYAYFLHSYRALGDEATLASCEHGERFAAVVARGNVVATQFHPEKSQATGLRLLSNFLSMAERGSRVAA